MGVFNFWIMWQWFIENTEWIIGGIAVPIIAFFINKLVKRKSKKNNDNWNATRVEQSVAKGAKFKKKAVIKDVNQNVNINSKNK